MSHIGILAAMCFTIGCTDYAVSTKKNPNCTTVVFGRFYSPQKWIGKYPALIVKENYEAKAFFGDIIKTDSAGIWFNRTKEGFLFSKPRYYEYKNVLCVINDRNEIVYGSIPKKYHGTWDIDIEIKPKADPNGKMLTLKLEANQEFSFCLQPNEYRIIGLTFKRGNDYVDYAAAPTNLTFIVNENRVNYVGDIYLDSLVTDSVHQIVCRIGARPSDATMGVMFGLIGAALLELSRSGDRIEHTIGVVGSLRPENSVESIIK